MRVFLRVQSLISPSLKPASVTLAAVLLLSAYGSAYGDTLTQACTNLETATVPAHAISLPTTGAYVQTATIVAAAGLNPEYCRVRAAITPVDPNAPPILMQLNLPLNWNHKGWHFGGGGMDGSVVSGTGNVQGTGLVTTPILSPLQRGYATFGSDSGHEGGIADATFGTNAEAKANFEGDQLIKTHDAAHYLIKLAYGSAPRWQYFSGGSNGGREAMLVGQRWPESYNGIIAYYPVASFNGQVFNETLSWQRIYTTNPGAWMDPAKVALLTNAVLAKCDGEDGVVDGLVSNPDACRDFDPSSLRCPNGVDTGDTCLSDVQIAVWKRDATRDSFHPYTLTGGYRSYPGFPEYNFSNYYTSNGSPQPVATYLSYFVADDPTATWQNYDYDANIVQWVHEAERMDIAVDLSRSDDPPRDFTKFLDRGGKLIWVQGMNDSTNFLRAGAGFFHRLQVKYGADNLRKSLRMYAVPGFDHGFGVFNPSWDSITTLENWAEKGIAPSRDGLVVADSNAATLGRTRPLCEWPAWPKYRGSGDINVSTSYECFTSPHHDRGHD